jgi:hypothetical protein
LAIGPFLIFPAVASNIEICRDTLNARLIDQSNNELVNKIMASEFAEYCQEQGSYSQRLSQRSSGFRIAARDYASRVSIGGQSVRQSEASDAQYSAMCAQGEREFLSFLATSSSSQSALNNLVHFNECVRIITDANLPILTGNVEQTGIDGQFLASFRYNAGQGPATVRLTAINGAPIRCYSNASDDQSSMIEVREEEDGWLLGGGRSLTCTKPESSAGVIRGAFLFQGEGTRPHAEVRYELIERTALEEIRSDLAARWEQDISSLQDRVTLIEQDESVDLLKNDTAALRRDLEARTKIGWIPSQNLTIANSDTFPWGNSGQRRNRTYAIPNPSRGAKEMLIYAWATIGVNTPMVDRHYKISVQHENKQIYKKFLVNSHHNVSSTFNSDQFWLPIPADRTIRIRYDHDNEQVERVRDEKISVTITGNRVAGVEIIDWR